MSVKRIIFTVLCALLVLILILTGVTVVKLLQLFDSPDPTQPTETEPSTSESTAATDPSTEPSTQPSTEATTPPTTQPTVPPTTQPTESTGSTEHVHNFSIVLDSQAPTCTDSGYKELQCACGETHWEVVEKLEHTYGYGETISVSCVSDGCTRYTCTLCGYVDDRNVVEALGHAYDNGVYHAATCTEDAYTEYTCANANCPEKAKIEVDEEHPKTGHNFGPWVEKDGVEVQTCGNCDVTQSTDDLDITKTMFLDSANNTSRTHEIHVGTDLVEMVYRYKIEDCINNGSIRFSYDYATGLTIKYKDSTGQQHEVVLSSTGDNYTVEEPAEPEESTPSTGSTESTENTESSEGTDPTESTGTNE